MFQHIHHRGKLAGELTRELFVLKGAVATYT
jgi:hypothetical protein